METKKTTIQIARMEKPHSYEFGKIGARHKIYYDLVEDLKKQIDELKECGFVVDEV